MKVRFYFILMIVCSIFVLDQGTKNIVISNQIDHYLHVASPARMAATVIVTLIFAGLVVILGYMGDRYNLDMYIYPNSAILGVACSHSVELLMSGSVVDFIYIPVKVFSLDGVLVTNIADITAILAIFIIIWYTIKWYLATRNFTVAMTIRDF